MNETSFSLMLPFCESILFTEKRAYITFTLEQYKYICRLIEHDKKNRQKSREYWRKKHGIEPSIISRLKLNLSRVD